MARAETRTLLALDEFARILGIHPLHFNQVVYSIESDDRGLVCEEPLLQYSWMRADKTGREELAEVIATAEQHIAQWLGFLPAPAWQVVDATYPRPANPTLFNGSAVDLRGYNQAVEARLGYVISGGREGKSLIAGAAAVVYSDADNDGYEETATITVATTVTDTDEIAVFYPGESGDNAWEVRPLRTVSIAGGVAVITVWRHQLLMPDLQRGFGEAASRAADATNVAAFLGAVDVYRRYNEPSIQAEFSWSPTASPCSCLVAGSCASCTWSMQYGCVVTRDARLGVVAAIPANWNAGTQEFDASTFVMFRAPDRIKLYLRSGYRSGTINRPLSNMDEGLARAITYYAASMLDRPLCGCKPLEAQVAYWRTDLAALKTTQVGSTSFRVNDRILNNPLGTTKGAVNAWQIISKMMLGEGVTNA